MNEAVRALKSGEETERIEGPGRPDLPFPAKPQDDSPAKAKGRLKFVLIGLVGFVLLALAGYYGWDYWAVGRFQVSTDDAYLQADSSVISPKVSGYVREVLVADNEPVKAGQPLAIIDPRDYDVALRQAKAAVESPKADIENAQAQMKAQKAIIAQAKATVAVDEANLTFAQQDNDRYVSLSRTGSGSLQNAQQAVSKLGIAQATLEHDKAAVVAAEEQIGVLQATLSKAQATLDTSKAQAKQAELNQSYTTIVSPINGVVGNRTLRVGQYVQAGTSMMAVVPLSSIYVVANYKETQLTDVRPGQPVEIEVDTFSGKKLKGKVDSIAPASGQQFALLPPDNATGNFTKVVQRVPVRMTLLPTPGLEGLLRPGMSVIPTINTKSAPDGDPPSAVALAAPRE